MNITRKHPFTGQIHTKDLPITQEELDRWEAGEFVQNVWPHLLADDREFILTGITDFDDYIKELPEYGAENINNSLDEQLTKAFKDSVERQLTALPLELKVIPQSKEEKVLERFAADMDGQPVRQDNPEYSPPSSKIYSTLNVSFYKFHKVRPIYKYLNENIYLAGGSLRTTLKCSGENVLDFDLFFKTFEEVQKLRDRLAIDDWEQTYECPLGFLYTYRKGKHKLQLICEKEYSSANILISSFDVSACMCCWHDGELTFTREFVRSVKTKKLRTCNVSFPVATMKRLIKYSHKGYDTSMACEDLARLMTGRAFDEGDFRHYID